MKVFLALLATVTALTTAQAQFVSNATPEQDGGQGRTGSGTFTLTLSGTTMTIAGTFQGLSSPSTLAHIHGPAGPLPATAGVIYDFTAGGLGLATLGGTSGSINGSFQLLPKGGGAYTVAQQMIDLNNGLWYVNVHSQNFGGGEIRGQILPVPEPSTWVLAGLGLCSLLVLRKRRQAA